MAVPSVREWLDVTRPREVWLVTGAHAVNEFYSVALPPILPLLVTDFNISYGEAGALLTVYFVMYSVFQLPAGFLADRVGQRRILAGGMAVMAVGLAIASVAESYLVLFAGQVVAGIGGSTYHPSGMSLISDLETGSTEGTAMGIPGLGGVTGTALAPALIGGLAVLFDWRLALGTGAAVGVGYAALFLIFFPTTAVDGDREDPRADGTGTGNGTANGPSNEGLRALLTDPWGSLITFPLRWWVLALFVTNLLIALEMGAVRTFTTTYLFDRTGESTSLSNAVFFVMLVGGGISSLAAGGLADRFDRRALGATTLAASAVAIGLTAVLPDSTAVFFVWFFLLGLVMYAVFPAMNALTSSYSDRSFSGSLFGVMLTAGSLGGAVGPLVVGVLAERFGMTRAFPWIAVTSVLGVISFLWLFRLSPDGEG